MNQERRVFIRSMQPLIGSVIGVGIFGLPFVFAKGGFLVGAIHLAVLAVVNAVLMLAYADILKNSDGHPRLSGVIREHLNPAWGHIGALLMFAATWGAMLAYVIIGGQFIFELLHPVIGGSLELYQVLFYLVSAFLVVGGLGFVSQIETVFVLLLLVLLALIVIGASPHVELANLTYVDKDYLFLPFGVVLFAFGGLAAVPEVAQVLGRRKSSKLRPAIMVGLAVISVVYLLFAAAVVGVTGVNTTQEAVAGLGAAVGDWALILGALIGVFSVFTSFLILALSVMDTLIYDYKVRYLRAWFVAVLVPFLPFLLGARNFIDVVGFTGGVLSSLIGLLVLFTYVKAKRNICTPKRCLDIPNWVLVLCALVFVFGLVTTVWGAF